MQADRRIVRVTLVAASLLLLAACDSPEERVQGHFQRGTELAEAGEPRKAMLEFRNVLKIDAGHVPSLYGMALALEQTGDIQAALAYLARVVESDATHVEARVRLAQALLYAGDVAAARQHAQAAYDLAPENADVLSARGAVLLRLGETERALADAYMALALSPEHTNAGMILIAERTMQDQPQAALALVDRFLKSAPDSLSLHLARLQLLGQDENRQEEFVGQLERMIEIFPEERSFRFALAQFHYESGNEASALQTMREMVALDPADADAAMQLVNLMVAIGNETEARAELDQFISASESAEQAFPFHLTLARLDIAAGKASAARARFDRLIEESGSADARIARARLHLTDGERAEAMALVEHILAKDTRNVDALALKAALQIDESDPETAVTTLRTALTEAPSRVDLLRLSAVAHERVGNPHLAGDNLAAAVRVSNYAPEQVLAHARFLHQRDRTSAASAVLDEALRRHPQDASLLAAAAELRLKLGDWLNAERLAQRLEEIDLEGSDALGGRIMAAALRGQDRLDESIRLLEPLAKDRGGDPAAFVQLVRNYIEAGRTNDAVHVIEGVLKEHPQDTMALLLRGALHALANETDAAVARLLAAVEVAPNAPEAWMALAQFHGSRDDLDKAGEALAQGIDAVPEADAFELHLALAGLNERRGDFDAAIDIYARLEKERPDSLVVANNLASLLAEHRADDPASVELATSLARRLADSPIPQFQDTFGWIQHLNGQHDRALESLLKASAALPDNPWVHYHLGQTYAALGETEKAREHLGRAREAGGEAFKALAEGERPLGVAANAQEK